MELVIQLYQYRVEPDDNIYKIKAKELRQHEINTCLFWNLNHPAIRKIHVLLEHENNLGYFSDILKQIPRRADCVFTVFGKQPLYADLVKYVEHNIEPGKIVCIQNSDIYFAHDFSAEFIEKMVTDNVVVTLTRHEEQDPRTTVLHHDNVCNEQTCPLIYDYQGSHDTFIFRTPTPANFPYANIQVPQNIYGGEAVFLKAWKDCGKTLINPCFDIKIFHKHMGRIYFKEYQTVATGDLANASPIAPANRPELQARLKSIYK